MWDILRSGSGSGGNGVGGGVPPEVDDEQRRPTLLTVLSKGSTLASERQKFDRWLEIR
jgi:hypothetical protein